MTGFPAQGTTTTPPPDGYRHMKMTGPRGVFEAAMTTFVFNDDGTKLYFLDENNAFEYTLSTAYDVSTLSTLQDTVDVSAIVGGTLFMNSGAFRPNGEEFYFNTDGGAIVGLDLSTPYDIGTGSYNGNLYSYSSQIGNVSSFIISPDGTKLWLSESTDAQASYGIYQYTMSTPFDLTTGSYNDTMLNVTGEVIAFIEPALSGRVFFIGMTDDNALGQATAGLELSSAYELSGASVEDIDRLISPPPGPVNPAGAVNSFYQDMAFNPDEDTVYYFKENVIIQANIGELPAVS